MVIEQERTEALRELDQYQKRVRREADEVIASLNSHRDEIDEQRKRLHELTVRAADYEVIQQHKQLVQTADEKLRMTTPEFSPPQSKSIGRSLPVSSVDANTHYNINASYCHSDNQL